MSRKGWILISLSLAIVAMVAIVLVNGAGAAGDVTVSMTASKAANGTVLRISITNGTGKDLEWLSVSGSLPAGSQYVSSTPEAKVEGGAVNWFHPGGLAAGATLQGFEYTVSGTGSAVAKAQWKAGSSSGTATSAGINISTAAAAVEAPSRGCLACHAAGKYSLIAEAEERAKARGLEHPKVTTNSIEACLGCHKQGSTMAISLADIVHPAHLQSEHFVEAFKGNCFTCHTIVNGKFAVINVKLETNEKGVQKNIGPIPVVQ